MIELLIVVLILGIISMIAIPNLLGARRAANEAAAIANTRMIFSSQSSYRVSAGGGNYGTFPQLQTAGLVDSSFGLLPATKSGYYFEMDVYPSTSTTQPKFDLRTRPTVHSFSNPLTGTGSRDYGVNEHGVIFQTTDDTPVTFDSTTRAAQGTAAPAGN